MRILKSQSQPAQHGASRSPHSPNRSAMSPLSTASITVAALLILTTPPCQNAPIDLQQATTHRPLSQIEAACSSYLTAEMQFWAADIVQELCGMMLVQKSKEMKVRENSKRTTQLHPLLNLASQLHTRRERGLSMDAELQGPGGIQSRGFFLYRPRNGRRFLEYE
ncbi:neuromedin-U isoform X1 [Salarias fasciatus]|uniref:neuromedin-U isoform X1 n=1 Tax=Salarias fasciatus TaxID=181472 RepID=UPI001176F0E2|nr:neuromedin-U isoform X1 [Salarias fasciatus]